MTPHTLTPDEQRKVNLLADLVEAVPTLEPAASGLIDGIRFLPNASAHIDYDELAFINWHVNRANGFPSWSGDGVPTALALIDSEISEAAEHLLTPDGTPDAYRGELADVVVRALDLAESLEPGTIGALLRDLFPSDLTRLHPVADDSDPWPVPLLYAYQETRATLEAWRRGQPVREQVAGLARLIHRCEDLWAASQDTFVALSVARLALRMRAASIVAANSARPIRHGGKRL